MIRGRMAKRGLAVLGLALCGAQAGHLIAYQLRFGSSSMQVQSSGAHAYFPALVKTSLGAGALVLLASLLLIAAAQAVARSRQVTVGSPSYLSLLATLFTAQLALFAGQETVESLLAGVTPEPAPSLLLWGMLGQLPAALAGAAVLRALWSTVAGAAEVVAGVVRTAADPSEPAPLVVAAVPHLEPVLAGFQHPRAGHVKRGPPLTSSIAAQ